MGIPPQDSTAPQTRLGLWDTISLIVGIIVGVGLFFTPQEVMQKSPSPWAMLGLWVAGGLLCLLGAFCFAELGSTYPRSGGEYVYLSHAFGPLVGFIYGWAQLLVLRTGAASAMIGFGFGGFCADFLGIDEKDSFTRCGLAVGGIAVFTILNILGLRTGKHTQNTLTCLKLAGLGVLLVAGFFFGKGWSGMETAGVQAAAAPGQDPTWVLVTGLGAALIAILWTYAGWQEAGYVASEIDDQRRTLPRAIFFGMSLVILLYLAVNLAYVMGIGFDAAQTSKRPIPAAVLSQAFGDWAGRLMALLIALSALGALNGTIMTSSRIYAAVGADHPLFAPLGWWNRALGTPVLALATQGLLSIAFVVFVSLLGTHLVPIKIDADTTLEFGGLQGFFTLLHCTAAVFWIFFLLTGVALFVLRRKDANIARPFTVPLYPLTPLLFCLCCLGMLGASIMASPVKSLIGLGLLAAGIPFAFLSQALKQREGSVAGRQPVT
jgi:amino acid transporter